MARASTAKKIAILVVATLLSAVGAELVARLALPALRRELRLLLPDGTAAPMAEAFHYLYHYTESAREDRSGPRGRLPSSFQQRVAYDQPRWDYFDADGGVLLATNALGFRDLEFAVEKPEGEYRVLALGDSFTYGLGVPVELSWPQVLEAQLGAEHGPTEVINAGWPNTAPADYAPWFATDGLRFDPDLVLLGLCLNDMAPVPMLAYPVAKPEPWLGGVSVLLNHFQREIEQRRLIAEPRDHARMVDDDPAQWNLTQAAILAIRDAAEEAGADFALVVLPMMSGLGESYPYRRMHEMVAAFAAEHQVRSVDLLPWFVDLEERDLWVHPFDQHPNHVGHALISAGVEGFLREEGLPR